MIENIRDFTPDETLTVYTNGGSKNFTHIEPFKFLPMEVHFNLDSMANIIAIKYVASIPGLHTIMYSRNDSAIIVEYHNHMIKFQECCDSLYYYDTDNKFISHMNYYSFLITAKENKEYFST